MKAKLTTALAASVLLIPSATDDLLGGEKCGIGPSGTCVWV